MSSITLGAGFECKAPTDVQLRWPPLYELFAIVKKHIISSIGFGSHSVIAAVPAQFRPRPVVDRIGSEVQRCQVRCVVFASFRSAFCIFEIMKAPQNEPAFLKKVTGHQNDSSAFGALSIACKACRAL